VFVRLVSWTFLPLPHKSTQIFKKSQIYIN